MKLKVALAILLTLFFLTAVSYAERAVKVKPKKDAEAPAIAQNANYYAVIIGNNNYRHLPKLKTAVTDATEVEKILKNLYGFKTKLLLNATRKDILSTINEFRKQLGSKDNLLIYYAGHGEYDKTADKAYWLPVDAQRDDPVDWIMADDITSNIKRIASKHILIVSDSCYSGTLTRATSIELKAKGEREEYINKMMVRSSRTLMASGGNEPVADSGGGKHSVFAAAFLKALNEATDKGAFTAEELFHGRVKEIVAGKSDQVPEYNNVKNSGHEGGDFVFQLAKAYTGAPASKAPEVQLTEPSKGGFSIDDLEQKGQQVEKNRTAWNAKLKEMKNAYNQVIAYEKKSVTPDLKAAAWERFIGSFGEDNPYSTEDETMKSEAEQRVSHWNAEQQKAEEKKLAMAPRPSKTTTGASYSDPATGMELVLVKGGCYQMGDTFGDGYDDEKPVHEVCVDDFYMGKYEVTNAQYRQFKPSHNSGDYKGHSLNGDNQPVVNVLWNDAKEYAEWLSNKTGKKYRLPTEAEWEYAARGGTNSRNYWGGGKDEACRYANVHDRTSKSAFKDFTWENHNCDDGYAVTAPVGKFQPNAYGLYDIMGNVWEWTNDWYDKDYYKSSPRNNPTGPNSGQYKALRGGSWSPFPLDIRASNRNRDAPATWNGFNGFRLLLPAR